MEIAYICDRTACEDCGYPECMHTFDINHAAHFSVTVNSKGEACYIERDDISNQEVVDQLKTFIIGFYVDPKELDSR